MQEPHGKTQPQTSSPTEKASVDRARSARRRNTTYRLRGIHGNFDRTTLETALCTCLDIAQDELEVRSLAYDTTYRHFSREKVATVTFRTTPERFTTGNQWQIEILHPGETMQELHTVCFDDTFEGFTPLTEAEQEGDTTIDCILIHGWAGHPIGSFSSPDGHWFWPRDSLCHEIPTLRVWLYGYSSNLRDSGSITDVYEYADTFRRALVDARKSADPFRDVPRPTIYIAHSLGGWILQDTIVRMAASDHVDDQLNFSMTKGVLLFGVPSMGMESEQLMSLLQEDNLPATYTASLLDERYGFRLRANQADDFHRACSKSQAMMYAFYETEKTPTVTRNWTRQGPSMLLVSKASATYGIFEARNKIRWKSDHNNMLKLRQLDVQHEILLSRLREVVEWVKNSQKGQDELSLTSSTQPNLGATKYHVPFSINGLPATQKFIERPAEMRSLEQVLLPKPNASRQNIFVLHGLGGIGKTQLAIEFMRLYHAKFSAMFFLDGQSKDSLKRSLAQCASRISIIDKTFNVNKNDSDITVRRVLEWLAQPLNDKWLMVFDNVDREFISPDLDPYSYDIKTFLPGSDHGSILVTTRLTQLGRLGKSLEVKKVGIDAAREILESWYTGEYDEIQCKRLLEHLDGLPLAIAQAGAYLQENAVGFTEYLRLYEHQQPEMVKLLDHPEAPLEEYANRSVWTTWILSYRAVRQRDECVANLLIFWSFIDRRDLWFGIFYKSAVRPSIGSMFTQLLGSIAYKEASFISAMNLLRRYSLIEGSNHANGYSMHVVIHRWIYFYLGMAHRSEMGMLALGTIGFMLPFVEDRDYNQLRRRLLLHAQVCYSRVLVSQVSDKIKNIHDEVCSHNMSYEQDILWAMDRVGTFYSVENWLTEAEQTLLLTLRFKEEALGEKHDLTLTTVLHLGDLYVSQDRLADAERMYMRALQGQKEVLGEKDVQTLNTINNLCTLYRVQGKLVEAEQMLRMSLRDKEAILGEKDVSVLRTVCKLGNVYIEQGQLVEAEQMFMRALPSFEEAVGENHSLTLDALHNLGTIYRMQGKLAKAKQTLMRTLQGRDEMRDDELISVLRSIGNLGCAYVFDDMLPEAEATYMLVLHEFEKLLGKKDMDTIMTLDNLGFVYLKQGRRAKAEQMLLLALQSYEEILGPELAKTHTHITITTSILGDLYFDSQPDKAKDMYTRAFYGYKTEGKELSEESVRIKRQLDQLELSTRDK